jgi:hypothetical protein
MYFSTDDHIPENHLTNIISFNDQTYIAQTLLTAEMSSTAQHSTAQYSTAQHSTAQDSTVQNRAKGSLVNMHQSFYLHSGVKFSDKKEIINKRNG